MTDVCVRTKPSPRLPEPIDEPLIPIPVWFDEEFAELVKAAAAPPVTLSPTPLSAPTSRSAYQYD